LTAITLWKFQKCLIAFDQSIYYRIFAKYINCFIIVREYRCMEVSSIQLTIVEINLIRLD